MRKKKEGKKKEKNTLKGEQISEDTLPTPLLKQSQPTQPVAEMCL